MGSVWVAALSQLEGGSRCVARPVIKREELALPLLTTVGDVFYGVVICAFDVLATDDECWKNAVCFEGRQKTLPKK